MRLVVTGASGQLGRLVVKALLDRVPAGELILVSRSPDSLAEFAEAGATVRYGDFEQPEHLPAAFDGGRRALVISTIGATDTISAHRSAFRAAVLAGVDHIVYTSVSNPRADNPFPPAQTHATCEQDLRSLGVATTILRNALYADLRVAIAAKYVQAGEWTTNTGAGSHAFVAREDCAAAAAAALTTDGHEGHVYDITGPEPIDARQYVAMLTEFGGRPIVHTDVDDDAYDRYRAAFMSDPANAAYFELFTGTGKSIRTGYLSGTGTGVEDLTGRGPRSLRSAFAAATWPRTSESY
jgi:NAD(P)H dehydrogenase (quinone)